VLVVIGILIALQINNWNEGKKANERTNHLLERTQKELLYNIKRCNLSIDFYRGRDSLLFKVVNNKVTYDDYKELGVAYLITDNTSANLVNEAFNNLIENDNPLSQKQDSIVLKLKELYGIQKKDADEYDLKMSLIVMNFLEKLKNEQEWYHKLGTPMDAQFNYFTTDPFYLNEVKHYEVYAYNNHLPTLLEFKHKAMDIYSDISDYLELKKDSLIVKNINDYENYIGAFNMDSIYDLNIVREKNSLKGNIVAKNDTIIIASFDIYPDSKDYFILDDLAFGQLIYDENGNVTKMVISGGSDRREFIKMD